MKESLTPILVLVTLILVACSSNTSEKEMSESLKKLDIQGHRGARGLMPENSIPGFIEAVRLGVTTLEMDVCVTKDRMVVVSHEPYFSSLFCLNPEGEEIMKEEERQINIYRMTYEEVKLFDCGSKLNPRFPEQKTGKTYKPLLSEVINEVEKYIEENSLDPVKYNIELKSIERYDNILHPTPSDFSKLVHKVIDGRLSWERITIQSFDFRVLQYFNKTYPQIQLAQLTENQLTWKENIDSLGFKPDIYSCDHVSLNRDQISAIKNEGIKVIPWTVNDRNRMQELIDWGVDGIITDYPNIALELSRSTE